MSRDGRHVIVIVTIISSITFHRSFFTNHSVMDPLINNTEHTSSVHYQSINIDESTKPSCVCGVNAGGGANVTDQGKPNWLTAYGRKMMTRVMIFTVGLTFIGVCCGLAVLAHNLPSACNNEVSSVPLEIGTLFGDNQQNITWETTFPESVLICNTDVAPPWPTPQIGVHHKLYMNNPRSQCCAVSDGEDYTFAPGSLGAFIGLIFGCVITGVCGIFFILDVLLKTFYY